MNIATVGRRQQRQDFIDALIVQFLQQVDAIVRSHLDDQFGNFGRVVVSQQGDLAFFTKVAENLGTPGRSGVLQNGPSFGVGQPFHELGGATGIERRAELFQFSFVLISEHFADFRQQQRIDHGVQSRVGRPARTDE